jgi:virginiamycin A acetyltransferase
MELSYPHIIDQPQGVKIGNDVSIEQQVRLMPGVSIGDGAVVKARAVVTRNLEPYGIYGGIPARLIKKRCKDSIVAALLDIKWWNWPVDKILRNARFFDLQLEKIVDKNILYLSIVD